MFSPQANADEGQEGTEAKENTPVKGKTTKKIVSLLVIPPC